jgi:hypothetical protein
MRRVFLLPRTRTVFLLPHTRTVFLLPHTRTVTPLSPYLLHFNTVLFLDPPLPERRAGIAEEPAEPSQRLVNKRNVSLCTSYRFFCFSTSTYLAELVRKTNRKTVEPYSLFDHKTLAVNVIPFFLFSFTSFERFTQTIK